MSEKMSVTCKKSVSRKFSSVIMAVLLTAWASAAFAVAAAPLLEVTGLLEGITSGQRRGNGGTITLDVAGQAVSGPLDPNCVFLNGRGEAMERHDFLKRYLKRAVIVELREDTGVVVSCKVKN